MYLLVAKHVVPSTQGPILAYSLEKRVLYCTVRKNRFLFVLILAKEHFLSSEYFGEHTSNANKMFQVGGE